VKQGTFKFHVSGLFPDAAILTPAICACHHNDDVFSTFFKCANLLLVLFVQIQICANSLMPINLIFIKLPIHAVIRIEALLRKSSTECRAANVSCVKMQRNASLTHIYGFRVISGYTFIKKAAHF